MRSTLDILLEGAITVFGIPEIPCEWHKVVNAFAPMNGGKCTKFGTTRLKGECKHCLKEIDVVVCLQHKDLTIWRLCMAGHVYYF